MADTSTNLRSRANQYKVFRVSGSLVKKRLATDVIPTEADVVTEDQNESGLFGNAISLAASRETELEPLQGLLPDGVDDNFISFGRAKSTSSESSSSLSSSSENSGPHSDAASGYESERSDIPEKAELSSPNGSPTARQSFAGMIFEQRVAVDVREAHLTLVTLPTSITIQGPCGIYGMGGEASINGYLIGQKRLLLSRSDRVTASPVKRLGTRSSEVTSPPHDDVDPETVFGVVNWAWVKERLESWSRRNSVQMSLLLIIQHRDSCKKQWFEKSRGPEGGQSRELPSFIANRRYLNTPPPVLEVISTVAKQRQAVAAVLGERDVGKSTMCRMLSNAFLSQHGRCFWIDLDLGQPEFTVPGCLSITKIIGPLTTDVVPEKYWSLEKCFVVGTTSISCPISYARAIKTLCDYVLENKCFPCVINTHGWVQSAGRRGSLECLRRLRASHVVHLGKSRGGDDMEWSIGRVINDPTQGFNSSISSERFWHGTNLRGGLPPVEESYSANYVSKVNKVEINSRDGVGSIKGGKRDREEPEEGTTSTQTSSAPCNVQIYRIVADYVERPKGDNVKRRRAKWFRYFNPLWSGNSADRTEVVFELSKLPFVAIAGSDEASAAVNTVAIAKGAVTQILTNSIVALCADGANSGVMGKVALLSSFAASPAVMCFGVVTSQQNGMVSVILPHPASYVADVLGGHKGRIGIVVSLDRNDNGGVITKALQNLLKKKKDDSEGEGSDSVVSE